MGTRRVHRSQGRTHCSGLEGTRSDWVSDRSGSQDSPAGIPALDQSLCRPFFEPLWLFMGHWAILTVASFAATRALVDVKVQVPAAAFRVTRCNRGKVNLVARISHLMLQADR